MAFSNPKAGQHITDSKLSRFVRRSTRDPVASSYSVSLGVDGKRTLAPDHRGFTLGSSINYRLNDKNVMLNLTC